MNFRFRSVVTCICSLPAVIGLNRVILSLTALSLVLTGSPADAAAALISNPESSSRPEEEIHLRYRIEEEVPRGTIVGNVVNDANLRSRYSNDAMQQIRFRFLADYSSVGGGAVATAVSTGGGAGGRVDHRIDDGGAVCPQSSAFHFGQSRFRHGQDDVREHSPGAGELSGRGEPQRVHRAGAGAIERCTGGGIDGDDGHDSV